MGVESRKKSVAEPAKPLLLGGTAIKPPERHGFDKIKYLIYDKETGEVFTRTPKSWALITVFYLIYYSFLAAFWYGMLQLFFLTLPFDEPKYQMAASIIGNNPGVGMRPVQADKTIDSSMLYLVKDAKTSQMKRADERGEGPLNADWAVRYQIYMDERYGNETGMKTCEDSDTENKGKEACKFDLANLGICGQSPFGYLADSGNVSPCIMIKLNKIYGWKPEPYDDGEGDLDEEPEDPRDKMPERVKELVRRDPNKVYMHCRGENPFDREMLDGKIKYFPSDQGIPFKYFPYTQAHHNYESPLVAVQIEGLAVEVLHHIECRAWFKGVRHSKKDRRGLVHLEILLKEE